MSKYMAIELLHLVKQLIDEHEVVADGLLPFCRSRNRSEPRAMRPFERRVDSVRKVSKSSTEPGSTASTCRAHLSEVSEVVL